MSDAPLPPSPSWPFAGPVHYVQDSLQLGSPELDAALQFSLTSVVTQRIYMCLRTRTMSLRMFYPAVFRGPP